MSGYYIIHISLPWAQLVWISKATIKELEQQQRCKFRNVITAINHLTMLRWQASKNGSWENVAGKSHAARYLVTAAAPPHCTLVVGSSTTYYVLLDIWFHTLHGTCYPFTDRLGTESRIIFPCWCLHKASRQASGAPTGLYYIRTYYVYSR